MNLESITLYFREGSSDKVYQASLEKEPGGRFLVNFAYGRRGSTMNTGTKTAQPVGMDDARTIYDRLVREKTANGYTPGPDGTSLSLSFSGYQANWTLRRCRCGPPSADKAPFSTNVPEIRWRLPA
ncbi:MAG: WGR domain-containing protein [Chthoniobacter sp.]|nr:WGR domain-containing protein [Chthoniobacter sp.]